MRKGTVVFWHDPDGNVGSGVGRVLAANSESLYLEMMSGSQAEVPYSEVSLVHDTDVVGVDENNNLLFYNAVEHTVFVTRPGLRADDKLCTDGKLLSLDSEERRRVAAVRESRSK